MAIWTLSGHNQNDMSFKAVSQLPCNLVSCVPIPQPLHQGKHAAHNPVRSLPARQVLIF